MSVANVIEISASTTKSFEGAILAGVARATDSIDQVKGAWIKEQKVVIEGGKLKAYRVTMNVTFVVGQMDK